MRTPHEIGNKIKQQNRIINSKPNFDRLNYHEGFKDALEWILEEPEYKRTIHELTVNELQKLLDISQKDTFKEEYNRFLVCSLGNYEHGLQVMAKQNDGSCCSMFITNNLDCGFLDEDDGIPAGIWNNQYEFHQTLKSMLAMEKPNESN